ncbi:polysaccharide deacetylase family protein [Chloroflexota bacterium]
MGKSSKIQHIVSLSFDDGFEKSNLKIAEIYEKFGLSACFNVIALGHDPDFEPPDPYHEGYPRGNFQLWMELQARGHEIMPHGLLHHNLTEMPFADAQRSILRCLEIFDDELDGFSSRESVYNFAYNASTPAIEAWLPEVVKAYRTGGKPINPLPYPGQVRLTTDGHGPGNCEEYLEKHIERLLGRPTGWLIYNTHGLDDEGWGPIRAEYLEALLDRLTRIQSVAVMPVGRTLIA